MTGSMWGYAGDKPREDSIEIPYDKEITTDLLGKRLSIIGKFKGMYVSFSPKIDLRTRKGKEVSSTYLRLLHTQVKIEGGGIMYESGFNESLEFFRKAFSFFNIIGNSCT